MLGLYLYTLIIGRKSCNYVKVRFSVHPVYTHTKPLDKSPCMSCISNRMFLNKTYFVAHTRYVQVSHSVGVQLCHKLLSPTCV